jgi:hypothetical protein
MKPSEPRQSRVTAVGRRASWRGRAFAGAAALSVAACAGVVEPPAGDERADAGGPVGAPDEAEREGLGARQSAVESPPGGLSESQNRDRLLDTLAEAHGRPDRCAEWASMGPNQQGVFLTLTDLMYGSWMYRPPVTRYLNTNSAQGNCIACQYPAYECRAGYACDDGKTCLVYVKPYPQAAYSVCKSAGPDDTYAVEQPRTGVYLEKMLDHVTRIHSMAAETASCGGGDNRMYFSADDALMFALRNLDAAPLGWRNSEDWSGPHAPFTQSRETFAGQPRGQTHQFAWDSEAVWVQKSGMATAVYDPHLVELDIDYNWIHDSNPECTYGGESGRSRYVSFWRAQGYPGDLSYWPTCSK